MKKFVIFFLFEIITITIVMAQPVRKYKMLSSGWSEKDLPDIIESVKDWHPFPDASDHNAWLQVSEHQRSLYIEHAEKYLGHVWPVLPATVFLEFVRNGNRSNYEAISFERRKALSILVMAELFENKRRFMDDISNVIWAICEETYWGIPAHVNAQKAGSGLPDAEEPTVDLFAAETGALLSWVPYLIGHKLDEISPLIRKRINMEVDRRILTPNFERDDFWWMGFENRKVNNWNPWINSNWLACVLLVEKDEERRVKSIHKIMRSLDRFIDGYPDDGGCDEGPNYWGRAGGALFVALDLLDKASNGTINISKKPLIKNMGQYIYKVYVGNGYFVNFADASARAHPDPALVYRFGKYINDPYMKDFAHYLAEQQKFGEKLITDGWGQFSRVLPALFEYGEIAKTGVNAPYLQDSWYPQTELMTARSEHKSSGGFYLAAKGGTNNESHNHNDVGSFIVYYDGLPVLIDIGVETYSAKTFSPKRYEIWTMQSSYHNLPLINGEQQKAGSSYVANKVMYSANNRAATISMDLAGAYPDSTGINYWKRTMTLRRGRDVVIADKYSLSTIKGPLELHFMTVADVDASIPGKIVLNLKRKGNTIPLTLHYNKAIFTVQVEDIKITDKSLKKAWGVDMHRILLKCKKPEKSGKFVVKVSE